MWNASRLVKDLHGLYLPEHRCANFGNVLLSMDVSGFRGVAAMVDIEFPITVIIGKNGSGKSTIAQLALCCYRYAPPNRAKAQYDAKNYYSLGSFFIKSNLDPEPYTPDAYLKYKYAVAPETKRHRQLTLFGDDDVTCLAKENEIKKVNSDWGGYSRRPDRKCIYFGMGFFVPHHEMGDRIYLDPKTDIEEERDFSQASLELAARILGVPYENLQVDTIVNQTKKAEMGFASRYGATYSENHMGCGEGRLIRMIDAIESAPEKSLIVIEEPETALHMESQYNLAIYLLDVCKRKRHQIIITTHSPTITEVMPMSARKKVERSSKGTEVINDPSIQEIIADLSNGHHKLLLIYVEDSFSEKLLTELIRRFKPSLLFATSIAAVGNKDDVMWAVQKTRLHEELTVIGIRDEDHTEAPDKHVFAYPSENPPEKEVFFSQAAEIYLQNKYRISGRDTIAMISDHHDYSFHIANKCRVGRDTLEVQCIQAFVESSEADKYEDFLNKIYKQCK